MRHRRLGRGPANPRVRTHWPRRSRHTQTRGGWLPPRLRSDCRSLQLLLQLLQVFDGDGTEGLVALCRYARSTLYVDLGTRGERAAPPADDPGEHVTSRTARS